MEKFTNYEERDEVYERVTRRVREIICKKYPGLKNKQTEIEKIIKESYLDKKTEWKGKVMSSGDKRSPEEQEENWAGKYAEEINDKILDKKENRMAA